MKSVRTVTIDAIVKFPGLDLGPTSRRGFALVAQSSLVLVVLIPGYKFWLNLIDGYKGYEPAHFLVCKKVRGSDYDQKDDARYTRDIKVAGEIGRFDFVEEVPLGRRRKAVLADLVTKYKLKVVEAVADVSE